MSANATADLVFTNGAVYTVDAARSWAEAVAVQGGRIAAVGAHADVEDLIGAGTEVVDLRGRMLLPGFQDAHVHPVLGGLDLLQCDLHDAGSLPEYEDIIRAYAEGHAEATWIVGGGWSMDVFPGGTPTKDVLDRLVPDRPVFLPNRDGHSAWVNTRALEIAGITRDTPDPADGRIERDGAGEPTGTLHEGAMTLVGDRAPATTPDEMYQGLLKGQAYLHSLGITGWQDAIVAADEQANNFEAYLRAAHVGRPHGARDRGVVVGPQARPRADRRPGCAAGPGRGGPVRGDERQDHAGRRLRELHRRRPGALPRRRRPSHGRTGGSRSWSRSS